jgi:hypothetical protein
VPRFTIAAVLLTMLAAPMVRAQQWGDIKGRVAWGPKEWPERTVSPLVKAHADKNHCLKDGDIFDEPWVVNKKNRGLQWTFVWLINADPKDKSPLPIHPALQKVPNAEVEIDQPVCAFVPRALAMRQGQALVAKNSSPVLHNVLGLGLKPANQFNNAIAAGGEKKYAGLVVQRLPLEIRCNIHPWMKAHIGIFDHPYFAVTGADGNFTIKNAPAGNYRLVAWNGVFVGGAKGNAGQPVTIPDGKTLDVGDLAFTPPPPAN